jgi:hypothetical protein
MCRACAQGEQGKDLLFSAMFGWWGIPAGILITPVQIGLNIREMLRKPVCGPSSRFQQIVKMSIARRVLERYTPAGR